jgi:hypothetical protein
MKAIGKMALKMVMEKTLGQMVMSMKAIGKMVI